MRGRREAYCGEWWREGFWGFWGGEKEGER